MCPFAVQYCIHCSYGEVGIKLKTHTMYANKRSDLIILQYDQHNKQKEKISLPLRQRVDGAGWMWQEGVVLHPGGCEAVGRPRDLLPRTPAKV